MRKHIAPYLATLCFAAYTAAISAAILACALAAPRRRLYMALGRVWARCTLATAGVRLQVEGGFERDARRSIVFMPNHGSLLDVVALALVMPDDTRFVAKRSLRAIPLFGWAMRATRACLFIDREARRSAIETLDAAAVYGANGDCIVVFPEGGRHPGEGIGPFKRGPFHLARALGAPIVPVAISGARALMPSGQLGMRSGRIVVRFGRAIDPGTATSVDDLSARVRSGLIEAHEGKA